jgi:hypothetical protein
MRTHRVLNRIEYCAYHRKRKHRKLHGVLKDYLVRYADGQSHVYHTRFRRKDEIAHAVCCAYLVKPYEIVSIEEVIPSDNRK